MAPPSTQLPLQRRRSAHQPQQQQAALRAGIVVRASSGSSSKGSKTSTSSSSLAQPQQPQQQPNEHATKPRSSYFPEADEIEAEYESEPSSIWERPGVGAQARWRLLPPPLPPGARLLAPLALEQEQQEQEQQEQQVQDHPAPMVDPPRTGTASRWARQGPASAPVALAESGALSPLLFLHPRALRRLHARLLEQQQSQPEALAVAASVYPTEPCLRRLPPHALPARGLGLGAGQTTSAFSLVLQEAVEGVEGGMEWLLDHCYVVQAPQQEEGSARLLPVLLEEGAAEASEAGYRSLLQWTLHSLTTATASTPSPLPLALAPIRLLVAPRGPETLSVRAEQLVPGLVLRLAPVAPVYYRGMEKAGGRRSGLLVLDAQGGGVVVREEQEGQYVGVWVAQEGQGEGTAEQQLLWSPALWAAALRFVLSEQQHGDQHEQQQRSFLVAALPPHSHQTPPRFFEAEWSWTENQHSSSTCPSFALLDFRADVSWDPEEEEEQEAAAVDEWEEAVVGRFRPAACPAVVAAFQRAASAAASSAPTQQQQQEEKAAQEQAASFASSYLSHIALPADSPPSLPPSPTASSSARPFFRSFGVSAASLLGGEAVSALTLEESRVSSSLHPHHNHHPRHQLSSSHPMPRAPVLPPPPQRVPPAAQEEKEEHEGFRTERERLQQAQIEALTRRVQELEARLSEAQAALALASSRERGREEEEGEEGGGRSPVEWVVVDGAHEEEQEEEVEAAAVSDREGEQQQDDDDAAAAAAAAAVSSNEMDEEHEEASIEEEEPPAPAVVEPVVDMPAAEPCPAPTAALVFKQLEVPKIVFPCVEDGEEDEGPIETPSVLEIEKKYLRMLRQEQQQGGGTGEDDG